MNDFISKAKELAKLGSYRYHLDFKIEPKDDNIIVIVEGYDSLAGVPYTNQRAVTIDSIKQYKDVLLIEEEKAVIDLVNKMMFEEI